MADPFEVSARALVAAYTVATLVSGRGFWGIGITKLYRFRLKACRVVLFRVRGVPGPMALWDCMRGTRVI